MEENKDPLAMINFNEAEYRDNEKRQKSRSNRHDLDRRICACGHPMARHKPNEFAERQTGIAGANTCSMPRIGSNCSCKVPKPVLEVWNTKHFLMSGLKDGGPSGHALIRGIQSVREKSVEEYSKISWLIPIKCDRCEAEDVKVTPIGIFISRGPEPVVDKTNGGGDVTVFLCDDCRFPTGTSENSVIGSEGN